jgi:predicted MFS family arabinose efflux permease
MVWIAGLLQEQAWSLMIHFPGFLSDLGASETGIGLLYSVSAVFGLLLRPTLGRLMDNLGRRPVLLVAGFGNTLALAALALPDQIGGPLATAFVVHRVMQIALFTALLTLSADVVPEARRTQGLAIYGLGGLIPLATGGALGDWLLHLAGFDFLFLTAAALSVASWLLVLRVPVPATGDGSGPRRGFWAALGQRNLLPVWWLTMLFAIGLEALFTFIRTYVDERGVGSVGLFFLVYGGLAIFVRILTSGRLDGLAQIPVIAASVVSYGAGFFVLAAAQSVLGLSCGAAFLGFGHGLLFPILSSQVVIRSRAAERGSAMAIFTSLFDLAVLTAAPAVGVIIDWKGYATAFGTLGAAITLGLAVYVTWERALVRAAGASVEGLT